MKSTVRTWGLAFIAAALMTGCGKDNATNGLSDAGNVANLTTGVASSTSTQNWSEFINEVEANRFQGASAGKEFYWTSSSYASGDSNCKTKWDFFTYCSYSSGSNQSYAPGISSRIIEADGRVLRLNFSDDNFGNSLQEIQGNLVARMKSATNIRKCVVPSQNVSYPGNPWAIIAYAGQEVCYFIDGRSGHSEYAVLLRNEGSKRYIFDHGGKTYLVDTTRPLAANPIGLSDSNGANMKVLYGSN